MEASSVSLQRSKDLCDTKDPVQGFSVQLSAEELAVQAWPEVSAKASDQ